jgi:hypothetical protein
VKLSTSDISIQQTLSLRPYNMLSRNLVPRALRCSIVRRSYLPNLKGIRTYSNDSDPFNFKLSPEQAEKLRHNKFLQKLANSPEALEAMFKTASLLHEKGLTPDSGKMGVMAQLKFLMDPDVRKQLVDRKWNSGTFYLSHNNK